MEQVAQLSQRDSAAEWVSYSQKRKTGTGRQYLVIYGHYRFIFNHCDVTGKAIEVGEKRKIRAITPFKVIQDHRGRNQSTQQDTRKILAETFNVQ